jgi:hypothetical protein
MPPGNCRSNGTTPDKGQSARDVEDDKPLPQQELFIGKRAIVMDLAASPRKNGKDPDPEEALMAARINPHLKRHLMP